MYIWQQEDWPHFHWDETAIGQKVSEVRFAQGRLAGKVLALGFDVELSTALEAMTNDIVKSSEIEGVLLDISKVRSSVAWQLGVEDEALPSSSHYIKGLVDVMTDAVMNYQDPLTESRLFNWHRALFTSDSYIPVGQWRTGDKPMQVVSGIIGRERVHYEAPPSESVPRLMEEFLQWVNSVSSLEPIVKAAVAAFWFVSIHPFADGNGRISRTLTDMLLTRSDGMQRRFYSMSAAIHARRMSYYDALEKAQKGTLDITDWILWFADCLQSAIEDSEKKIEKVLAKNYFWQEHSSIAFNARQRKVISRLLDDFEGKLSTAKWAKLAHCSTDTALRDLQMLVDCGIFQRKGVGRGIYYELI